MNDEEKNSILPTRHSSTCPDGGAKGDATERQMRANLADTNSCRTSLRLNADGSTTRLRTRGGWCEYVTECEPTTSGDACKLDMDSGIVDLVSASWLGVLPDDHESGILHRTQYVQQVIAAHPDGDQDRVIGRITSKNTSGKVVDDALPAESFIKSEKLGSPFEKKHISQACPASMFTGKMRQYVQALYGRHDHAEFLQVPGVMPQTGACLYFDHEKKFSENASDSTVIVFDTNCGIFTDAETGNHYLISTYAGYVKIRPMRASTCAEKLRKKLIDDRVSLGAKARIETYILSQSYPDLADENSFTLSTSYSVTSAMGYGWHFNGDGSVCDIVVTEYLPNKDNLSTHLRRTFSRNSLGGWTVADTLIEQTTWKHLRYSEVIAFPDWTFSAFRRLGVLGYTSAHGDAPFYVFYKRVAFSDGAFGPLSQTMQSELTVCRYSTQSNTVAKGGVRNPQWLDPDRFLTVGDQAADRVVWESYTKATTTFSCGGHSITLSSSTNTEHEKHRAACGAPIIPPASEWWVPDYNPPGTIQVPIGNGPPVPEGPFVGLAAAYDYYEGTIMISTATAGLSNNPYDTQALVLPGGDYAQPPGGGVAAASFVQEEFDTVVNKSVVFLCCIPFYDAEAAYVSGQQTTSRTETGTTIGATAIFFNMRGRKVGGVVSDVSYNGIFGPWDQSVGGVDYTATFTNRVGPGSTTSTAFVVGQFDKVDVPFTSFGNQFFAAENTDIIPVFLSHKSSTFGLAGHSVDFQVYKYLGANNLVGKPVSFVGWA